MGEAPPDATLFIASRGDGQLIVRPASSEQAAAAFGSAAIVTIAFNTALAWIKDAFDPVNAFMASLTGHPWIAHGLADVALFIVLGSLLTLIGRPRQLSERLALGLVGAAMLAGGGLALWFVLF